jgi:LuxR family maltose regulon positive regulatory protein
MARHRTHPPLLDSPCLLEQLDAGMAHLVTLLVAPAGSGKSALLHRWIVARDWPVAWVALDAGDDDPARFVQHLAAASQALVPGLAAALLPGLGAGGPEAVQDALYTWLNALAGRDGDFCLILDGYEQIDAPAVHQVVAHILDHPPPRLHLFIAARAEPPLPLPRLRVRRQLLEVQLPQES